MSSSAAPHGGPLWWCFGGGLGLGGSWEGAGHAGSASLGGGGACVWACIFAFCSLRGPLLFLSLAPLFFLIRFALFVFVSGGGLLGCGVSGAGRGCGCVLVPMLVWAWVSWGTGVGWLLRSGIPVCASAPMVPVSGVLVWGALTAGGRRVLGSAWVAWPGARVRVGVFMAWADWVVDSVGVAGLSGWWQGAGQVSGMCAPKEWWVGLRHCGRCNWWRRYW